MHSPAPATAANAAAAGSNGSSSRCGQLLLLRAAPDSILKLLLLYGLCLLEGLEGKVGVGGSHGHLLSRVGGAPGTAAAAAVVWVVVVVAGGDGSETA